MYSVCHKVRNVPVRSFLNLLTPPFIVANSFLKYIGFMWS